MGYPVWQSVTGNLGRISSQEYFELELIAYEQTNPNGIISFELIAGRLPPGLQLSQTRSIIHGIATSVYQLQGVGYDQATDIPYSFVVRATASDGSITDAPFSLTITGNYPPEIVTTTEILGDFLDGTAVDIQLQAVDFNPGDTLTWALDQSRVNLLNSPGLPVGLSLTTTGQIIGNLTPVINPIPRNSDGTIAPPGYGLNQYNLNNFVFDPTINRKNYQFTVTVTDGKFINRRDYQINVYNHADIAADNTNITADLIWITADLTNKRTPLLITRDLGIYSRTLSGEYYSFKFDGIDFDNGNITYQLAGANAGGWDSDQVRWDMDVWESGTFTLPPGLSLDEETGWLTGKIPEQVDPEIDYNFGIRVVKVTSYGYIVTQGDIDSVSPLGSIAAYNNVSTSDIIRYNPDINNTGFLRAGITLSIPTTMYSETRIFYMTILGAIKAGVVWYSPADLGTIYSGDVSDLKISATANSGRRLYYRLQNGSHLPQGLQLLNSGDISGKPSFQEFTIDQGQTTIDLRNYQTGFLSNQTTVDKIYNVTVIAEDYSQTISSQKVFTIRAMSKSYEPYENLYLICHPPIEKRRILSKILHDTDIFQPEDLYRPNDPYYGVSKDIKALCASGMSAQKAETYINAMQTRHYDKTLYFGNFHTAQGKDANGVHLYDVIYVDLVEPTRGWSNKAPVDYSTNMNDRVSEWINPRVYDLPENHFNADTTLITDDTIFVYTNSDFFPINRDNIFYLNDRELMTNDILLATGVTNLNALPEWMNTVQPDGKIVGFVLGAVLAYVNPGQGPKTLYNLKKSIPYDMKLVPFVADRYIWDNNLSMNFDVDNRRWPDRAYTTFDGNTGYQDLSADYTVDFAVDVPFNHLNRLSLVDLISEGGLDGVLTSFPEKTVLFYTQELYNGYESEDENGWLFPDLSIVPGNDQVNTGLSSVNQRGGIWKIKYEFLDVTGWDPADSGWDTGFDVFSFGGLQAVIALEFIQEVKLNQSVAVTYGNLHGGGVFQYTTADMIHRGLTQPFYIPLTRGAVTNREPRPTTFDKKHTRFINNADQYLLPMDKDTYLKFPQKGIFKIY